MTTAAPTAAPTAAKTSATGTLIPTTVPETQPILEQLSDAIQHYARDYVTVNIYSVNPVSSDGDVINEGDEVTFRMRINNSGPLEIINVALLVQAEAGATGVKKHGASSFQSNETTTPKITVPANQPEGTWTELADDYHFLAGPANKDKVELVSARIWYYDADLDYMLNTLTERTDETEVIYSHKVQGL